MQKMATYQYIAKEFFRVEVVAARAALVKSKLHVFLEVRGRPGGVLVRNGILHFRRGRGKTRVGAAGSRGNNSI